MDLKFGRASNLNVFIQAKRQYHRWNFMILMLNNLSKEYNIILDVLENLFPVSRYDVLTTEIIHKKLNQWFKKLKSKEEEKTGKEKALGACNKQHKQSCYKSNKYGHNSGDGKCPENKNEKYDKNKNQNRMKIKINNSMWYATTAAKNGT